MIKKLLQCALVLLIGTGCASFNSFIDILRGYPKIMSVSVGEASSTSTNSTVTITSMSPAVAPGDVVMACGGSPQQTTNGLNISFSGGGGTEVFDQGIENSNLNCTYKRMTGTVDTSVSTTGSNTLGTTLVVTAFRNVSDISVTDATATSTSAASGTPDSPSITTTRPEVAVISALAVHVSDTAITAPTGYGDQVDINIATGDVHTVGMAWTRAATTGANDPGAWGGVAANNGWLAISMALRPIMK